MKKEVKDIINQIKNEKNAYKKKPRKTKINISNGIDNTSMRKYIKDNRLSLGLTQSEMAKKIGISFRCYQEYEEGKSNIINNYSRKMMEAFGFHIIDDEGNKYL
ncbi:MAG: helix-turn-helix transcriptional regulator [Bacilli bacterium]|nr:helix-turn-helix transcriptional regulator [Bacilli bacterium]